MTILAAGIGVAWAGHCSRLPALGDRPASTARTDTAATSIGTAIAPLLAAHPALSGIYPLRDARDAFAARYMLAARAERSLDVQYYIWRRDMSGTLLFKSLCNAADRGVRVRLLLDDNNTPGLDPTLAALDAHPLIEVRLFNPFVVRRPRLAGYLTNFSRLNRRMHNKSFTADNQATIIGGRNVGDEYFGATDGVLFSDVDVIAIGPVVQETSRDFDRYWSSPAAYPVDRLLRSVPAERIAEIKAAAVRVERDPAAVAYMTALRASPFVRDLVGRALPMEWAPARLISDDPAKVLGRAKREDLLPEKMKRIFGQPAARIDLVSPYFVPGSEGVELFSQWAARGVTVRILTNALEATDVAAVHAGYAKRRKALLAAGITLYELRARPRQRTVSNTGSFGSSGSSLHAKTFAVDGSRVFVGSFNFDPRSAELNTEMGFVIDSPPLAGLIATAFRTTVPINAYQVRLSESGNVQWLGRRDGKTVRYDVEPGTSFRQRAAVSLLSRLPIEWLL